VNGPGRGRLALALLLVAILAMAAWMRYSQGAPTRLVPVVTLPMSSGPAGPRKWPAPPASPDRPRSVIFLIGDGMGMSQIAAARLLAYGPDGWLALERLPVTGLVRTHTADDLVTRSEAAATALASGHKTLNHRLGTDPGGRPLRTILEAARDAGLATGLVTTSTIVDATPGGFAAHVRDREMGDDIAAQLTASGVDVMLGGGRGFFLSKGRGGERRDGRDLFAEARSHGYQVVSSAADLRRAASAGGRILGAFGPERFNLSNPDPSLPEMTAAALRILSRRPSGFFLMAEQEDIDEASHEQNLKRLEHALLLFDRAVREAVSFAARDGHTLVVVTADHATGGLSIDGGSRTSRKLRVTWSTLHHTGEPVPLFAYGPGAGLLTGMHDNTEIPRTLAALLGLPLD
jgi:alkaline phosphatase